MHIKTDIRKVDENKISKDKNKVNKIKDVHNINKKEKINIDDEDIIETEDIKNCDFNFFACFSRIY